MKLSVLFLVFCGFAAVAGYSNDIPGYGRYSRKRGYRFNDDSDCQLKLYRVKEFQGKPYIVRSDRSKMRGLEKSVQTLGKHVQIVDVGQWVKDKDRDRSHD